MLQNLYRVHILVCMKKARCFFIKKLVSSILLCSLLAPQTLLFAQEPSTSTSVEKVDIVMPSVSNEGVLLPTSDMALPLVPEEGALVETKDTLEVVDVATENDTLVQESISTTAAPVSPNFQGDTTAPQKVKPETDPSTGALIYTYPIDLPQGVRGLTPTLSLKYNSQDNTNDNILGYGWSLSIPYIKRQNLRGTDKLYGSKDFVSSELGEIVETGRGIYAPRATSTPLTLTFSNNTWSYTTKEGLTYTYGDTAAARQDDPQNASRVYTWMLSSIVDTYGNTITYTYTKDQWQIYPENITYGGIYTIIFNKESRQDSISSYKSGFLQKTNYRINQISIQTQGTIKQQYTLSYGVGNNTIRSLLISIQENIGGIYFPKTTFNYSSATPWWPNATSASYYTSQTPTFSGYGFLPTDIGPESARQIIDINGDAYPDIISGFFNGVSMFRTTYSNNAFNVAVTGPNSLTTPFIASSQLLLPGTGSFVASENRGYGGYGGYPQGYVVGDLNGDMFPDIKQDITGITWNQYSYSPYKNVFLNTKNSWATSTSWGNNTVPVEDRPTNAAGTYTTSFLSDMNGDGFTDFISQSLGSSSVQLNTGKTFFSTTPTQLPSIAASDYGYPDLTDYFDINGDGLLDYMILTNGANGGLASLNTGNLTWVPNSQNNISLGRYGCFGCAARKFFYIDINADGFVDIVPDAVVQPNFRTSPNLDFITYLNTGKGFIPSYVWATPAFNNLLPADWNADGMIDFIALGASYLADIYLAKGAPSDLLTSITTSSGVIYSATYKSSAQYKDMNGNLLNPKLPMVVQTVNTMTETDPATGQVNTHTYTYKDGTYYFDPDQPTDRKFAGFGTVVDSTSTKTVATYYHTGSGVGSAPGLYKDSRAKIGRAYREDIADLNGAIMKTTYTKWDGANTRFGGTHVRPISVLARLYDKTPVDTATSYTYEDETGDVQTETKYGKVFGDDEGDFSDDTADTARVTRYTYAVDTTGTIRAPSEIIHKDKKGTVAEITKYYYDTMPFGVLRNASITATEQAVEPGVFIKQSYIYDPLFGVMTSSTDGLGNTTTYTYDTHGLYPIQTTNPIGHTIRATYDYSIGKPLSIVDQNNNTTTYTYDPLGRTLTTTTPDPQTAAPALQSATTYDDTPGARFIQTVQYRDQGNSTINTIYLDGFDRQVQKNTQTDKDFVTSWTKYTPEGLAAIQTLPVSVGSDVRYPITTQTELYTTNTYDALGRIIHSQNVTGVTKKAYNGLTTHTWDHAGVQKDTMSDAFGNLVAVGEYDNGKQYITRYEYDIRDNLIGIIDALGNVRSFTYDMQNRRLSAEDIHPIGSTAGIYRYQYDDAGNMTQMRYPSGVVVYFGYDKSNRKTFEDSTKTPQKDIVYMYDTCTNGIGKICTIIRDTVQKDYEYTATGSVGTETISIDKIPFSTKYTYDLQGNTIAIVYPSGVAITYMYGAQGPVQVFVDGKHFIQNISYNDIGAPTYIERVNGVTTYHAYDPLKLYQLTKQITTTPSGTVQDTTYTYDSRGLIIQKDTAVSGYEEKVQYVYDDLLRLISAESVDAQGNTRYSHVYTYSPVGSVTSNNKTLYTYKTHPHAPIAIDATPITYDKNGNRTSFGKKIYSYTYKNELASYKDSVYSALYTYDDAGSRVRVEDTTDTMFPNKYTMYDNSTNTYTKYIYLGSTLIGQTDTQTSDITNIFTNYLSSSEATTDTQGNLLSYSIYEPYGLEQQNPNATIHKGYIGEYTDPTNLSYLNARYYDTMYGQFLSEDPVFWELGITEDGRSVLLNPQLQNSYSYAGNNPINASDTSGRISTEALLNRPIATIVQAGLWAAGSYMLGNYNIIGSQRPVSEAFMMRSLSINPSNLSIDESNQSKYGNVVDALKNSSYLGKAIGDALKNNNKEIFSSKGFTSADLDFAKSKDPDLFTAIGKANLNLQGDKKTGEITVKLSDTYNYETNSTVKGYKSSPVFNTLNNAAAISQKTGAISPYNYSVTYKTKSKNK